MLFFPHLVGDAPSCAVAVTLPTTGGPRNPLAAAASRAFPRSPRRAVPMRGRLDEQYFACDLPDGDAGGAITPIPVTISDEGRGHTNSTFLLSTHVVA